MLSSFAGTPPVPPFLVLDPIASLVATHVPPSTNQLFSVAITAGPPTFVHHSSRHRSFFEAHPMNGSLGTCQ